MLEIEIITVVLIFVSLGLVTCKYKYENKSNVINFLLKVISINNLMLVTTSIIFLTLLLSALY